LQVECAKLAFADREKFYGDPNFAEIPIATLLSDAYNDERRKLISDKASLDFVPGSVEGFGSVVKLRRQEGQREAVGAMRAGEPYLAWGSPGGDQQDQWTTQFFLRHVHAKLNLQEAIDAPAWHSEHFPISFWPRTARPGVLVVENRVPKAGVDNLKSRGHVVETGPDWSEGRLTAASKVGRRRRAAANPRGMQGYAAGR